MTTDSVTAAEPTTYKTVYRAPEAEIIMAAVAMRSNFQDRFMFLDKVTAECFAPLPDGSPSLSERIYRLGLIKEGNNYRYTTPEAVRDQLGLSDKDLEPYYKCFNRPAKLVQEARDRMLEAAQRRSFTRRARAAIAKIENPELAVDTVVAETTIELTGVAVASKKPGRTAAEIAKNYGKVNSWSQYPKPFLLRSKHPVDTTPFGMGSYNVVLAPPGTGKTVLALWKAVEVAQAGGYVIWNGWEMDADDLIDMVISRFTGIAYQDLVDAREGESIGDEFLTNALTDEERAQRDSVLADMFAEDSWGHRIRWLTGGDALPMNNLLPLIRRLRAEGRADFLVLDHLHISVVLDERGNPIQDAHKRATAASQWARQIAADTGIPMYVAAQFNRSRKDAKSEGDEIDVYTLEMIRDSGAIEQDAFGITAIQLVVRDKGSGVLKKYRRESYPNGLPSWLELGMAGQVMKNRKGGGVLGTWFTPIIEGRFDFKVPGGNYADDMIENEEGASGVSGNYQVEEHTQAIFDGV